MAQDKIATPSRGGSSARACIFYILGEELTEKVEHGQRNDSLQPQQKTHLSLLFAEARARSDLGVGTIWSPAAGGGNRPSSIYARGVWSLETAAYDIETVVRTQPRVKQPVQHIIISLSEAESKTVSDETLIRMSEMAVDHAGFTGHQALFTVHRDTPNAHCHVAVASVNAYTMKAWDRYHGWNRLDEGVRLAEIAFGLEFGHGLAVVRDAGLPTQRVEPATKAERLAWAQERGLAKERLEDRAHSFLADSDGLELPEDRRERIVTKLRKMLDGVEERGEEPLRADVHLIAAGLAATIEPGPPEALRLRLMERAEEGSVVRESTDSLGDTVQRVARWTPSTIVFDVPLEQLAPGPLDAGGKGTQEDRKRQAVALARRAWLANLGDVARSEREVEELLERDPGRVSRDIIAGGEATFTVEDVDRWTCSRLSDGGPEAADRILREDPTIVVRSADTEHPLLTIRPLLQLEEHVFDLASNVTQQRNPLFDRGKLERAFADVEAAETKALGKPFRFTAEQRAVLDLLEHRYGTCNGVAGAGKSALMAVVRRYAELTGQPIVGLATAQLAAENLAKKSGIASVNSTRGLVLEKARGEELVESNAIVIVDEYSMTSLESAKEILDRIAGRPAATVLYLGGGAQLENIAAGNTHRVLTEAAVQHGHHRELTEVFRQREGSNVAWMRDVVPALDKAILEADPAGVKRGFRQFDAHGHIVYHEDRKSEIAGKADDIVRAMKAGVRVIAPSCERVEVKYVNRAVRHQLGHVGKGILYQLEERQREFSPNDRVVFTKNAEWKLGVLNGYTGTVLAVKPRRISIKLDGGRVVDVDPVAYPHLEWGFAVTTHKSQGQGDPLVVASITKSDDARTAYVALTRCEEGLHVHTRLLHEDASEEQLKRGVRLLEYLTSDASLRPKDDALLFEEAVRRTGGPDTPWAKAVRRGLEQDADPLRQQHRAEMNERFQARGYAVTQLLTKTREQRERAEPLDEPKREQRLAGIATGERRELEKIDRRYALESFVSWAVRNRKDVEREAPFLERAAERREQHEAQRAAHDVAKEQAVTAQSVVEILRTIEPEPLEQKKSRGMRR
jgi:hypothetical protein